MELGTTLAPTGRLTGQVRRANAERRPSPLKQLIKHGLPTTRSREINLYRLKNFRNVWRGLWRYLAAMLLGVPTFVGMLHGRVIRSDGSVLDLGLISMRVVTDAGVAFIVDAFQGITELENMKYHGYGTGTNSEAAANTGLQSELTTQYQTNNTRPTGSTTEGSSANIYRTVATVIPDSAVALTEQGVFSGSTSGADTMLDRSVFAAVNLNGSGDAFQTTYEFELVSGN